MEELIRALRACGNRHRLRLLKTVLESKKPVRQQSLVRGLKISQFLAARYLQILTHAGLLQRTRKGLAVLYQTPRGASEAIKRVLRLVRSVPLDDFGISEEMLEKIAREPAQ